MVLRCFNCVCCRREDSSSSASSYISPPNVDDEDYDNSLIFQFDEIDNELEYLDPADYCLYMFILQDFCDLEQKTRFLKDSVNCAPFKCVDLLSDLQEIEDRDMIQLLDRDNLNSQAEVYYREKFQYDWEIRQEDYTQYDDYDVDDIFEYDYDSTDSDLMHDIESNPGPCDPVDEIEYREFLKNTEHIRKRFISESEIIANVNEITATRKRVELELSQVTIFKEQLLSNIPSKINRTNSGDPFGMKKRAPNSQKKNDYTLATEGRIFIRLLELLTSSLADNTVNITGFLQAVVEVRPDVKGYINKILPKISAQGGSMSSFSRPAVDCNVVIPEDLRQSLDSIKQLIIDASNLGNSIKSNMGTIFSACASILGVIVTLLSNSAIGFSCGIAMTLAGLAVLLYCQYDKLVAYVAQRFTLSPQFVSGFDEQWVTLALEALTMVCFAKTIKIDSFDSFSKSLPHYAKGVSSAKDVVKMVRDLLCAFMKKILACYEIYWDDNVHSARVRAFSERFMKIYLSWKKDDGYRNTFLSYEICALHMELNQYLALEISPGREFDDVRKAMNDILVKLKPIYDMCVSSQGGTRITPAVITLIGTVGNGKTSFMELLILTALDVIYKDQPEKLAEVRKHYKSYVYAFSRSQKHFDGFNNQPISIVNDAFAATTAPGQPGDGLFLVDAVGNNIFSLPAANLYLKEKIFFSSQVIIVSTNLFNLTATTVKDCNTLDAPIRRLSKFAIVPCIKREYRGAPNKSDSFNFINKYDFSQDEIDGMCCEAKRDTGFADIWTFYRFDMKSQMMDQKQWSTPEMLNLVTDYLINHFEKEGKFNNDLVDYYCSLKGLSSSDFNPNYGDNPIKDRREAVIDEWTKDLPSNIGKMIKESENPFKYLLLLFSPDQKTVKDPAMYQDPTLIDLGLKWVNDFGKQLTNAFNEGFNSTYNKAQMDSSSDTTFGTADQFDNAIFNFERDLSNARFFNHRTLSELSMKHFRDFSKEAISMELKERCCKDDTKLLIKEYLAYWKLEKHRPTVDQYDDLTDTGELMFALLEHIDMYTIEEAISWGWTDSMFYYAYYWYGKTNDKLTSLMESVQSSFSWFNEVLNVRSIDCFKWAVGHPGCVVVLGLLGIGVVSSVVSIASVGLWKLVEWMTKDFKPKVVILNEEASDYNLPVFPQSIKTTDEQFIISRMKNMVIIKVCFISGDKEITKTIGGAFGIGGKVVICPSHYALALAFYDKHPDIHTLSIKVFSVLKTKNEKPLCTLTYDRLVMLHMADDLEENDRMLIVFPDDCTLPPFSYVVDSFPSKNWSSWSEHLKKPYTKSKLLFPRLVNGNIFLHECSMRYSGSLTYPAKLTFNGKSNEPIIYTNNDVFSIDVSTIDGECGFMGFMIDDYRHAFGVKELERPVLSYMHVAGDSIVGHGLMIYREDLEVANRYIKTKLIRPEVECVKNKVEMMKSLFVETKPQFRIIEDETGTLMVDDIDVGLADHHILLGLLDYEYKVQQTSKIKGTSLKKKLPLTRLPANINPKRMPLSRFKYGQNTSVVINKDILDLVTNKLYCKMVAGSNMNCYRGTISRKDAIMGNCRLGIPPLSTKTSGGPSFKMLKSELLKTGNYPELSKLGGSKWFLNKLCGENCNETTWNDDYKNSFYKKVMDYMDSRLQSDDRLVEPCGDNLKDELRDVTKNPRLFCSFDKDYLTKCKEEFGAFGAWIVNNRIRNGYMIGVNCYTEWSVFYDDLNCFARKFIPGDIGQFDADLVIEMSYACKKMQDMFYNDYGSEAFQRRSKLFETMIQSIHVTPYEGKALLYMWLHGNTSGNFLTTDNNSIIVQLYIYYVIFFLVCEYRQLDYEDIDVIEREEIMDWIFQNISIKSGGDDHIIAIKDEISDIVKFSSLRDGFMKYLKVKYTDDAKTKDGIVPEWKSLEECTMYGRGIVVGKHKGRRVIKCPLRKYTLMEMCQFFKGLANLQVLEQNIDMCLLETAYHDQDDKDIIHLRKVLLDEADNQGLTLRFRDPSVAFEFLLKMKHTFYSNFESNSVILDINEILNMQEFEASPDMTINCQFNRVRTSVILDKNASENNNKNKETTSSVMEERLVDREVRPTIVIKPQMMCDLTAKMEGGGHESAAGDLVVKCDTTSTTCFTENNPVVRNTFSDPISMTDYESDLSDIKDFLAKPFLIDRSVWTTSQVPNTPVWSSQPSGIRIGRRLIDVSQWADKIRGFNLVKGDFVVRVEVNANKFQQGCLLLHYVPCFEDFLTTDLNARARFNANMTMKRQHPCIEIIASDAAAELVIPYVAPSPYYCRSEAALGPGTYGSFDWGTVFLDVMAKLRTGLTGETEADITTYIYWKNVSLSAPSVPQMNKNGYTVTRELKPGPVEKGLKITKRIATALDGIPLIEDVAGPVAWVADFGARLAHVFGWSKPANLVQPTIIMRNADRYGATSDGATNAIPLSLTSSNTVGIKNYSIRHEDEMSIKFLNSIPYYLVDNTDDTANTPAVWNTSDAQGVSLFGGPIKIKPGMFTTYNGSTYATHYIGAVIGAPWANIAAVTSLWRGSFDIKIKFIKTMFHTGKLMAVWTPSNLTTSPTVDNTTSLYSLRQIIDIRDVDEFILNLPYLLSSPYIPCSPRGGDNTNTHSGFFDLLIVNQLRCPETASPTIDMLVYITPGADFEFQMPTFSGTKSVAINPQMNSADDKPSVAFCLGIGDADVKSETSLYAEHCIGEKLTSLRQLMLRYQPWSYLTSVPPISSSFLVDPYYVGVETIDTSSGALVNPTYWGDSYNLFASMYAFVRGSMRVKVVDPQLKAVTGMLVPYGAPTQFTTPIQYPVNSSAISPAFNPGTGTLPAVNNIAVTFSGAATTDPIGVYEFTVPYQSKYPISLVSQSSSTTMSNFDSSHPLTILAVASNSTEAAPRIFRAIGDDCVLSFFVNATPLYNTYT
jgi:hypothetical protein